MVLLMNFHQFNSIPHHKIIIWMNKRLILIPTYQITLFCNYNLFVHQFKFQLSIAAPLIILWVIVITMS